jgi:predicted nucleic acid-binding protein
VIVIDASAAIELLLATPRGIRVSAALRRRNEILLAPHLLDVEVAQVLRRLEGKGQLTTSRAAIALEDFAQLDITRYGHDTLLERVWQLRSNLTAYDAAYVALAEAAAAALLTCDAKLAGAPGHRAKITLVV